METRTRFETTGRIAAGGLLALAMAGSSTAQVTSCASLNSSGVQGDSGSETPSVSPDGRYVAFTSYAANLVAGDTNAMPDVFVRDRQSGTTERVSIHSSGAEGNGNTYTRPSISDDGRYVAFESDATNLVAGDTNAWGDVFVRDRQSGTTERVSVGPIGAEGDDSSGGQVAISADGRYVAFMSYATNLVVGDTNFTYDVFIHDRQSGTTERVSVASNGAEGNNASGSSLAMSPDARFVAFGSAASNLVAGDTNSTWDAFVRDRQSGTTERASIHTNGSQGNHVSGEFDISISADGLFVGFPSFANNLVAGDTNAKYDVFVRDRQSGTTERVSVSSGGAQGGNTSYFSAISADGRYVAFTSVATNLVVGDTNAKADTFLRDRQSGTTERVSVASSGAQGNEDSGTNYFSMSPDARYVAFASGSSNFFVGDANFDSDIFIRDRAAYTPMTSLCDPGVGGVTACPCANPPSGSGRGCNNSANTGGAILSSSGVAYLSQDTLVFTTSGENSTALSLVLQGNALVSNGQVLGAGVHCAGGSVKLLYAKTASGGAITAPNVGIGDPVVSARSAALGDTILPGQSRWYVVTYRDPVVLRLCFDRGGAVDPFAEIMLNATQTGQITWSP